MEHGFKEEKAMTRILRRGTYIAMSFALLLLGLGAFGFFKRPARAELLFVLMTVVGFLGLFFVGLLIFRIQAYLKLVVRGRKDVETLLNTLDEGVLVFDREGVVQPGCSQVTTKLFGMEVAGKTFVEILRLHGPGRDSVLRWIELTFSQMMSFDDMIPLAPKSFERLNGRYIALEYRAIFDENGLFTRIMVVASDRTEEQKLREQSEVERATASLVMTILKDRTGFHQFIADIRRLLQELNTELSADLADLNLPLIMRNLHTIKSVSAQYHVIILAKSALNYESELTNIQSEGGHRLRDFVPVLQRGVVEMARYFETFLRENGDLVGPVEAEQVDRTKNLSMESIYKMSQMLSEEMGADSDAYQEFLKEFVLEDIANGVQKYQELVKKLAEQQSKVVDFELVFSGIQVCTDCYQSLISAMVHVFRNAIDHGIETTVERQKKGKAPGGKICVSFERVQFKHGTPRVKVRISDDGAGIDEREIKCRLTAREILSEEKINSLSRQSLLQYIFHHGMTTREKVTNISGRGVGLDTVKYEAAKLGGTAWVESELDRGTVVFVEVPIYESPVFRPVELSLLRRMPNVSKGTPPAKKRLPN